MKNKKAQKFLAEVGARAGNCFWCMKVGLLPIVSASMS